MLWFGLVMCCWIMLVVIVVVVVVFVGFWIVNFDGVFGEWY